MMPKKTVLIALVFWSLMAAAGGNRYALEVDGLACPFCAYGIEKNLNRLDGVARVETDVASGRVIVEMDDQKILNEAKAREAIEDSGFTLRSFKTDALEDK